MNERLPRALYTWVDVQFALEESRAAGAWPDWMLAGSVYFDSILLRILNGTKRSEINKFLESVFGARFHAEPVRILLESVPDQVRALEVEIEESKEANTNEERTGIEPFFRRLATLPTSPAGVIQPPALPSGTPDLVAFYSFKGGVGRTTHLLALFQCLTSRDSPARVLVIDADLEAPGITSLLAAEKSFRPAEFSFADLLALAQSDSSEEFADTLLLAAYSIRRQTLNLNVSGTSAPQYFLPAYRSETQSMRLDVRPEHLVARPGKAWVLSETIARLGKLLEVDVVLVDLRAGFSELASPFLFDPRLHRVIVTTPSRQSLDGTNVVLKQLSKLAPPSERADLRDPIVVISFVLPELVGGDLMNDVAVNLLENYPGGEPDVDLPRLRIEYTTFGQEFLYLQSVSDAVERLSGSNMSRVMRGIADELAVPRPSDSAGTPAPHFETIRNSLSSLAGRLEYAESGEGNQFLRTEPLRILAQIVGVPPVAVIMGSKGAGKTYTYLQVVRFRVWSEFVREASGLDSGPEWGLIWPLLHSKNLKQFASTAVAACRQKTMEALEIKTLLSSTAVADLINESLRHPSTDDTWWRHRWFRIFAQALGIEVVGEKDGAARIIEILRQYRRKLIFLVDGLEDLFPELEKNNNQRNALRALLQGVPNYLREVPDSPVGILIFVRGDLARAAISQNFGQFSHLYEALALRWNEEEALRLAVWLANSAGLVAPKAPETMSIDEAKAFLTRLWGRKLGPEDSREARTAEWVIAALSDFLGQIQARDLVRFLKHAAASSRNTTATDRILAPRAIRDAILPCSKEKIDEIKQEIPRLESIFAKLQSSTDRRIPFDAAGSGLAAEEIRFLEAVGALVEDKGEYFMPEIFRLGLGFQLSEGKRPRVLGLARRVLI